MKRRSENISFFAYHCMKDPEKTTAVVHRLDQVVASDPRLVIVQRESQQRKIEQNDPQKLIKRGIDGHEPVKEKELDNSVEEAFETGLFSPSEIVFDKRHQHAVVAYSFVCGGLCGSGGTVLLEKIKNSWKITKRCGGWVS